MLPPQIPNFVGEQAHETVLQGMPPTYSAPPLGPQLRL